MANETPKFLEWKLFFFDFHFKFPIYFDITSTLHYQYLVSAIGVLWGGHNFCESVLRRVSERWKFMNLREKSIFDRKYSNKPDFRGISHNFSLFRLIWNTIWLIFTNATQLIFVFSENFYRVVIYLEHSEFYVSSLSHRSRTIKLVYSSNFCEYGIWMEIICL